MPNLKDHRELRVSIRDVLLLAFALAQLRDDEAQVQEALVDACALFAPLSLPLLSETTTKTRKRRSTDLGTGMLDAFRTGQIDEVQLRDANSAVVLRSRPARRVCVHQNRIRESILGAPPFLFFAGARQWSEL
jgi:hypothetical protein